ncbi:MAG TPA: 50S ribosomal protein L29 [Candidatus Sulfotelmatobacter sp.]|nr:50S ribosomal protein L29 [Candidatus Sulfotelmatobacter sp.]
MKTKDRKEIFTKTDKELIKALKEAKDALFNFNLELKQNKLKNTRQIFWKKKEIAYIKTAQRQKELEKGQEK